MTARSSRIGGAVLVALFASLSVAACDALAPPSPSPRVTDEPVVVPPSPGAAQVVACLGITSVECAQVAQTVVGSLPADRGSPFSLTVRLSPCADGATPCPDTLAARQGTVLVEYADEGIPSLYRLSGTPARPEVEPAPEDSGGWTDPIQPGSPVVEGLGPFEYQVGHCGLLHAVDFDGSFWVLVGDAPGDHPALGGSDSGSMRLLQRDRARYTGTLDQDFELARFPGAKRFQLCR
jgi:hypothetical protein